MAEFYFKLQMNTITTLAYSYNFNAIIKMRKQKKLNCNQMISHLNHFHSLSPILPFKNNKQY